MSSPAPPPQHPAEGEAPDGSEITEVPGAAPGYGGYRGDRGGDSLKTVVAKAWQSEGLGPGSPPASWAAVGDVLAYEWDNDDMFKREARDIISKKGPAHDKLYELAAALQNRYATLVEDQKDPRERVEYAVAWTSFRQYWAALEDDRNERAASRNSIASPQALAAALGLAAITAALSVALVYVGMPRTGAAALGFAFAQIGSAVLFGLLHVYGRPLTVRPSWAAFLSWGVLIGAGGVCLYCVLQGQTPLTTFTGDVGTWTRVNGSALLPHVTFGAGSFLVVVALARLMASSTDRGWMPVPVQQRSGVTALL